jgi:hypothetical protein
MPSLAPIPNPKESTNSGQPAFRLVKKRALFVLDARSIGIRGLAWKKCRPHNLLLIVDRKGSCLRLSGEPMSLTNTSAVQKAMERNPVRRKKRSDDLAMIINSSRIAFRSGLENRSRETLPADKCGCRTIKLG